MFTKDSLDQDSKQLMQHESKENDLLFQAYFDDIGSVD